MNNDINNAHDKFVKESFSDAGRAAASFEKILPSEIVDLLDLSSLIVLRESYLDKNMSEYFSDLVFEIPLQGTIDEKIEIALLFEHKSQPDKHVLIQVGYYMFAHYFRCTHANPKKKLKPIVPLVYYQGKKKWKEPELWHLFRQYPDTIKHYIPTLNYIFVALHSLSNETLESIKNTMMSAAMIAQKWRHDPVKLVDDIAKILSLFENKEYDWNFLQMIFVYVLHTSEIKPDDVQKLLESIPKNIKEEVMTTYAMIQKEERAKGRMEGKLEGRLEGKLEGKLEGRLEGRLEGKFEEKIEIVLKGFENGLSIQMISNITGLSVDDIKNILRENGRNL